MKKIRYCMLFLACVLFFGVGNSKEVNAASCYTMTPKMTDALYEYMTEIYIKKFPQMGLEICYGTTKDKQELQTLADVVTKNYSTNREKAREIAEWTNRNIEYASYMFGTNYYPMDVFRERKGNCVGYAQLMQTLMRSEGIPAVISYGMRGDMVNVLQVEDVSAMVAHAWVYAWYDNDWHLYDPLFDVYDESNKDFMAKWYFPYEAEGITPYYEGMNTNIIYDGNIIYYKNGKFINNNGIWEDSSQGGKVMNDAIAEIAYNKCSNGSDGVNYIDNPANKDQMEVGECYTNGWIAYSKTTYYYARPNSIVLDGQYFEKDGKLYYLSAWGMWMIEGKIADTMVDGQITTTKGADIYLAPTWIDEVSDPEWYTIHWTSDNPQVAVIDPDTGMITAKSEGSTYIKMSAEYKPGGWNSAGIRLYVKDGTVVLPDYSDRPITKPTPPTEQPQNPDNGADQPAEPQQPETPQPEPPVDPDDSDPAIPGHAHNFGSWIREKNPTALATGRETRTCSECGETQTRSVKKLTPVIKLSAKTLPLQVKKSTTALKVTAMQKGDKIASFTSSNPKIVKVHKTNGKLTALKKTGKATILVKLRSGKTAKCIVTVQKGKVTTKSIKLSAKKLTLKKGKTAKLTTVLNPLTSQDKVTFTTSKKKIATVTSKGVIKGRKKGTTKITVKSGKKKVTCTVTVK